MKIYPDITKLWGNKIREAGMTKNQAKKVLEENEETQKAAEEFVKSPPSKGPNKSSIQSILKRLNVF